MEILLHLFFVVFSTVHKILNIGAHFSLVDGAFFTNDAGLYILVQILLRVEFRTVRRDEEYFYPVFVCFEPLF